MTFCYGIIENEHICSAQRHLNGRERVTDVAFRKHCDKEIFPENRPAAAIQPVSVACPAGDVHKGGSCLILDFREDLSGQHGNHGIKFSLMLTVHSGQGQFTPVQVIAVRKCPVGDGFGKASIRRRKQYAAAFMPFSQGTALCFRTGVQFLLPGFCFLILGFPRHSHGNLRRHYPTGQGIPARIRRKHIAAFHAAVIGRGAAPGHGDLLRCRGYCFPAAAVRFLSGIFPRRAVLRVTVRGCLPGFVFSAVSIRDSGIFGGRGFLRYPVYLRRQFLRQPKLRFFRPCWDSLRFHRVRKRREGRDSPILRCLIFCQHHRR